MTKGKRISRNEGTMNGEAVLAALREWSDSVCGASERLQGALSTLAVSAVPTKALSPEARRERLWQWRREEARRRGVAPYLVLTNGVVEKLSAMEVLGREDLRRIPGIGPRKLDVYGDAILKVLGA